MIDASRVRIGFAVGARRGAGRLAPLLALLLAAGCSGGFAREAPADADAVDRFALTDADSGAALPDDVARGLNTDERVLDCFTDADTGMVAFERSWFAVHRADLDADGRADWIVNSAQDCLRGSAEGVWWLYRDAGDSRRLLLRTPGRALTLLSRRSVGFRDVEAEGAVDDLRFRYDGEHYVPAP